MYMNINFLPGAKNVTMSQFLLEAKNVTNGCSLVCNGGRKGTNALTCAVEDRHCGWYQGRMVLEVAKKWEILLRTNSWNSVMGWEKLARRGSDFFSSVGVETLAVKARTHTGDLLEYPVEMLPRIETALLCQGLELVHLCVFRLQDSRSLRDPQAVEILGNTATLHGGHHLGEPAGRHTQPLRQRRGRQFRIPVERLLTHQLDDFCMQ